MNFKCRVAHSHRIGLQCLLAGSIIPIFFTGCSDSRMETEVASPPVVASTPSVATLSAKTLTDAFTLNENSANQTYKGNVITVYGPVQEKHDEGDKALVVLTGGNGQEVFCAISSRLSGDADDLEVGRTAIIKGKCFGIVKGNLSLDKCIIEDRLRELKAKAKSGDSTAQFDLAKALETPAKEIRDIRRAFHLYCQAAETGHEDAKGTVMKALANAWSPETNSPVVWQWLKEEAEAGNTEACYLLGILFNVDEDFGIDPKASVPWFKKASDGGHQEAMYTMAVLNYEGELVPTNKAESARLLSLVDPQRQPRASESLGLMNLLGDGVPVDIPAGLSHLETAVANGRAQSASTLGRIYLDGVAVPKDREKAREWFLKAAEMGDAYGQVKAGLLLGGKDAARFERSRNLVFAALSNDQQVAYAEIVSFMTDEVTQILETDNPPLAPQDSMWFRKINGTLDGGKFIGLNEGVLDLMSNTNRIAVPLADLDVAGRTRYDPEFRSLLARSIITENVYAMTAEFKPPKPKPSTNDWTEALRTMAVDGEPDAMAWLGISLLEDPKTREEGIGWLKKSAEAGSAYGQNAMGAVCLNGIGQSVDKETAFRMFKLASNQGHSESTFTAGRMLMAGAGCEKDTNGGLRLIRQAADEGEFQAILFLGRYFYGDRWGSRDAAQAFAWFRWGAVLGSPEAQYWLGRMYYEGKGLPKDYNRAIQWLSASSGQGYQPASQFLESDAANRQEMAKAKAAYRQELERHANQVERIRQNPKYDLVNYLSGAPRRFSKSSTEREAYGQFQKNLTQGYSIRAAASKAWEDVGGVPRASSQSNSSRPSSSSGSSRIQPSDSIIMVGRGGNLEAAEEAAMYGKPLPPGARYVDPSSLPSDGKYDGRIPINPFGSGGGVTYGLGDWGRIINPNGVNF